MSHDQLAIGQNVADGHRGTLDPVELPHRDAPIWPQGWCSTVGAPNTNPTDVNFGFVAANQGNFPRQIQLGFKCNW